MIVDDTKYHRDSSNKCGTKNKISLIIYAGYRNDCFSFNERIIQGKADYMKV